MVKPEKVKQALSCSARYPFNNKRRRFACFFSVTEIRVELGETNSVETQEASLSSDVSSMNKDKMFCFSFREKSHGKFTLFPFKRGF